MNLETADHSLSGESEQVRRGAIETSSSVLSPHELAILESGKKLYEEAIDSTREFSKTMIGISLGAIPVHFAIVKYLLGDTINIILTLKMLLAIPPVLFLLSSVFFIVSFLPKLKMISLDDLREVREARNEIVCSRRKLNLIGTAVLLCGILLSMTLVLIVL